MVKSLNNIECIWCKYHLQQVLYQNMRGHYNCVLARKIKQLLNLHHNTVESESVLLAKNGLSKSNKWTGFWLLGIWLAEERLNVFYFMVEWFVFYYFFFVIGWMVHITGSSYTAYAIYAALWVTCFYLRRDYFKELSYNLIFTSFTFYDADAPVQWVVAVSVEMQLIYLSLKFLFVLIKSYLALRGFQYLELLFCSRAQRDIIQQRLHGYPPEVGNRTMWRQLSLDCGIPIAALLLYRAWFDPSIVLLASIDEVICMVGAMSMLSNLLVYPCYYVPPNGSSAMQIVRNFADGIQTILLQMLSTEQFSQQSD